MAEDNVQHTSESESTPEGRAGENRPGEQKAQGSRPRRSRRAATTAGAPVTVPDSAPLEAASGITTVAGQGSAVVAEPKPAKRTRRRAAAPAGAPVVTPPEPASAAQDEPERPDEKVQPGEKAQPEAVALPDAAETADAVGAPQSEDATGSGPAAEPADAAEPETPEPAADETGEAAGDHAQPEDDAPQDDEPQADAEQDEAAPAETAEDESAAGAGAEGGLDLAADLAALKSRSSSRPARRRATRPVTTPEDSPFSADTLFQAPAAGAGGGTAGPDPEIFFGSAEVKFEVGEPVTLPKRRATASAGSPSERLAALETSLDVAEAEHDRRRTDSSHGGEDETDSEENGAGATEETGGRDADRDDEQDGASRRRRRRGGRGRRGRGRSDDDRGARDAAHDDEDASADDEASSSASGDGNGRSEKAEKGGEDEGGSTRRRRRRRRSGQGDAPSPDDPPNTVVKVRDARDEVKAVRGSTRLEAKKQRRREGRESGRRRPVITEAEFLARRESVKRDMLVRQGHGRTQIAVLEDDVLVEHYVAEKSHRSMVGNVYLGKVQNVLPSMEAAFVDIGKGRNAVLYAGEVNWDAAGLDGQPRRIEFALKAGDSVLVQVTKDPMGHKGARLTAQISLPGRYLVYVPGGSITGISRKLPDKERSRLKKIMKSIIPSEAGVIVRTAAEGASEDELSRDVERLRHEWSEIEKAQKRASAPAALSDEPDLSIKVVRDVFNEDFSSLRVQGDKAWSSIEQYLGTVAPDLRERAEKYVGSKDIFASYRVDEQLLKAMDRKVYLPSGGSLVIDRTEAMTVIDVNTGKFTGGAGGSLEETVTKNNLEAAEEIVRQLRLRDIGGIIVVDFIDMVLESNRDLVLRRLVECLSRDRTKHQVAEVTSLGLVQMTRKRIGQGLVEVFSHVCEACNGRGLVIDLDSEGEPPQPEAEEPRRGGGKRRKSRSKHSDQHTDNSAGAASVESAGGGSGTAQQAVAELVERGVSSESVHVLASDEKAREMARATIASIAKAGTNADEGGTADAAGAQDASAEPAS